MRTTWSQIRCTRAMPPTSPRSSWACRTPAPATARCLVPAATPGILALSDCPFHSLPQRAPELMCHINQAFIDGLLRGLGNKTVSAAGLQVGRRLRLAPCAGPLEGDCVLLTSATRVQAFRAARCWFQGRGNPGSGWPPGLASGGGGPRGGPWPWCRSLSPSAALTLQGHKVTPGFCRPS